MASKIELINTIERIDFHISRLLDQRRYEIEELEEIEAMESLV